MYKRIFMQPDSSQLPPFKDFYRSYCKYNGSQRSGDSYLREVYKSAMMLIFDRFGEKGVNYLYKPVYICLYRIRLERRQVKYATMCTQENSGWVFAGISQAKRLSDLTEIVSRAARYKQETRVNFNVPIINELFNGK
jgi:hypothetical protein